MQGINLKHVAKIKIKILIEIDDAKCHSTFLSYQFLTLDIIYDVKSSDIECYEPETLITKFQCDQLSRIVIIS